MELKAFQRTHHRHQEGIPVEDGDTISIQADSGHETATFGDWNSTGTQGETGSMGVGEVRRGATDPASTLPDQPFLQ